MQGHYQQVAAPHKHTAACAVSCQGHPVTFPTEVMSPNLTPRMSMTSLHAPAKAETLRALSARARGRQSEPSAGVQMTSSDAIIRHVTSRPSDVHARAPAHIINPEELHREMERAQHEKKTVRKKQRVSNKPFVYNQVRVCMMSRAIFNISLYSHLTYLHGITYELFLHCPL